MTSFLGKKACGHSCPFTLFQTLQKVIDDSQAEKIDVFFFYVHFFGANGTVVCWWLSVLACHKPGASTEDVLMALMWEDPT